MPPRRIELCSQSPSAGSESHKYAKGMQVHALPERWWILGSEDPDREKICCWRGLTFQGHRPRGRHSVFDAPARERRTRARASGMEGALRRSPLFVGHHPYHSPRLPPPGMDWFPAAAVINYHKLKTRETYLLTSPEARSLKSAPLGWNRGESQPGPH